MKLAIDLGHGQDNGTVGVFDPGACANGLREYDLIRDYGYDVAGRMRDAGAEVLVLDSGHVSKRDNRAASWGATHYLAIHFDSGGVTATGVGVFINRGDPHGVEDEAAVLGQAVADAQRLRWRGVREKDFYVLNGRQPDMLLETCFISNRSDVLLYRENRAAVIDAVVGFLCDWGGLEATVDYDLYLIHANKTKGRKILALCKDEKLAVSSRPWRKLFGDVTKELVRLIGTLKA